METPESCTQCGGALRGRVQFGLCPRCLMESFLTSTGPYATSGTSADPGELCDPPRPGEGRFRLVGRLGHGGMGEVWLAEDSHLGNLEVALKFLKPSLRAEETFKRRLRVELIRSRELQHPNIVKVHDWHDHGDGEPSFISMQYVRGTPLSRVLDGAGGVGLPYHRLHPILVQLCSALIYAHEDKGLVHRDIKPGNILLTSEQGRELIRLSDFGLTQPAVSRKEDGVGERSGGGTRPYMSPQQLTGEDPAFSDDVFALGVTIYELMTGRLPFGLEGCRHGQLLPMSEALRSDSLQVPERVQTAVTHCLALDPDRRTKRVANLLTVLQQNPPTEEAVVTSPPGRSWAGKFIVTLLGCTVLAGFWPIYQKLKNPPTPLTDRATLIVKTDPPDALVTLRFKEETNAVEMRATSGSAAFLNLSPGRYALTVSQDGYNTNLVLFDLYAGVTNWTSPPLERLPNGTRKDLATLVVNTIPPDALVVLRSETPFLEVSRPATNGQAIFQNLAAAAYTISVRRDNFGPSSSGLTLLSRQTVTNRVVLTNLLGHLDLRSDSRFGPNRPTEELEFQFWDGDEQRLLATHRATGTLTLVKNLTVGDYVVRAVWKGHSFLRQSIRVLPGQTTTSSFPFRWMKVEIHVDPPVGAHVSCTNNGIVESRFLTSGGAAAFQLREGVREFVVKAPGYHAARVSLDLRMPVSIDRPTNVVIRLKQCPHPLAGDDFINGEGMKLLWLPSASCWMGRTEVTKGEFSNIVKKARWNITNGMNCLTSNGLAFFTTRSFEHPGLGMDEGDSYPVVGVNWHDATNFCEKLTQSERAAGRLMPAQRYRLPTRDQWQKACYHRMESNAVFWRHGNFAHAEVLSSSLPWPKQWEHLVQRTEADEWPRTASVGKSGSGTSKAGFLNLHDNVQEWCRDPYTPSLNRDQKLLAAYPSTLAANTYSTRDPWMVVCGGSWFDHDEMLWNPTNCHCAQAGERMDFRGFRVVIEEEGQK